MKLSCTQENLHQGLSVVGRLPTKTLNLPILKNILLRAEEKIFTLAATNLEMAIITTIRGKVETSGEFTVPAKLFCDYAGLLPHERVDVELSGTTLDVKCGTYQTKMRGIPSTEFPLIPKVEPKQEFSLEIEAFRTALSQVLFAAANHESRPELCGVYCLFADKSLTMAATDSFRLAERSLPLKEAVAASVSVIIPARTMAEVSRILGVLKDEIETDEKLIIGLADGQAVFKTSGTEIISRVVEGQYPDYRQIIPTQTRSEIVLTKESLLQAVKNASLFSRSGLYDVTLQATPNGLVITSGDQQTGENSITLEAELQGDPNRLTVNHKFLVDGVSSMESDTIRLKVIDGANPILVIPEGVQGHLYIVMPIKQ